MVCALQTGREQAEPCWAAPLAHSCCLLTRPGCSEDAVIPLTRLMHGKPGSSVCWGGTANGKQMCPCPVAQKNGCCPQGMKDFLAFKFLLDFGRMRCSSRSTPALAPFHRAPVTVSTGVCLKTDPTSSERGCPRLAGEQRRNSEGISPGNTFCFSQELWRAVGNWSQPPGSSAALGRQSPHSTGGGASLEVSLRHGLELAAGEHTVPALRSSAAPAACFPASRVVPPPAQPSVAISFPCSFPSSAWGPDGGVSSMLPPQPCPTGIRTGCTGHHKYSGRSHAAVAEPGFLSLFYRVWGREH